MPNSEHKIVFSMGTSGDPEVIRALESIQKVLNGTGETMKMLETNGVRGMQNWLDSLKKVSEVEKSFKSLTDTLSATDKAMIEGILSKEKTSLFSGMSAAVDVLKGKVGDLGTEIKNMMAEAAHAESIGDMARAKALHGDIATKQQAESNLAKVIVSASSEMNKMNPPAPTAAADPSMMQRMMQMFSYGGMFGGGFNPGQMMAMAGRALPAAGAAYLGYQAYNTFLDPRSQEMRQVFQSQSVVQPGLNALSGDPTTAILRARGLGTAEQVMSGGMTDPAMTLKYLAHYAMGALTPGVNASDYAQAQIRSSYESLDQQRFSGLQLGDRFRSSVADARLRESRMFGSADVEGSIGTYATMGISEETGRMGSSLLATYASRNADISGTDRDFLSAGRDYGINQAGMTAIARRYGGATGTGVRLLTSSMAVAGLGVQDQASREAFQNYIAQQQEQYGANVGIGDNTAMGGMIAGTQANINSMGLGGSVGKLDITNAAIKVGAEFTQQEQAPGSARHMLMKASLLRMGVSAQMAEIFIQMDLTKPSTKEKLAAFLKSRTGKSVTTDQIGAGLADSTRAANRMATLGVSDQDQQAAMAAGIDAKGMVLAGSTNPVEAAAARANMDGQNKMAKALADVDSVPPGQKAKPNYKDEVDKDNARFQKSLVEHLPSMDTSLQSILVANNEMLKEFQKQTTELNQRGQNNVQTEQVKSFGDWQKGQAPSHQTFAEYQEYMKHQVTDTKKGPKGGTNQ